LSDGHHPKIGSGKSTIKELRLTAPLRA